ncbi:MAG: hypothetical protein DSY80_06345 [Desulfocapsa sp.]|nr:MAG: hypothetical protein DSY80_06345 [Desulfocapsa sp.]
MRKDERSRAYHPTYLSAETLAYMLDCAVSTIKKYVQQGKLPRPVSIGELKRFRWEDVDDFISMRTSPSNNGRDGDNSINDKFSLRDVNGASFKETVD